MKSKKIIEKTKTFVIVELENGTFAAMYDGDQQYYYNSTDLAFVISKVKAWENRQVATFSSAPPAEKQSFVDRLCDATTLGLFK